MYNLLWDTLRLLQEKHSQGSMLGSQGDQHTRQLGTQLDHMLQLCQRLLRKVLQHTSGYRLPLQDQVHQLLYRCEKDLANQNVTYNKIAGR